MPVDRGLACYAQISRARASGRLQDFGHNFTSQDRSTDVVGWAPPGRHVVLMEDIFRIIRKSITSTRKTKEFVVGNVWHLDPTITTQPEFKLNIFVKR